ncbi:MAG: CARDB domain-containing protein [Candidatus Woesearchaeota archaeon]|nr:CARDB domain-containing protein [Candidatus Woesearchaeota archaeon]
MKLQSLILIVLAVLFSLPVAALGNDFLVPAGAVIDLHQYDEIFNPYAEGNVLPPSSYSDINPNPQPLFIRDLAVDIFRFEAPAGTHVGDYVTLIGTIKNNGMFSVPLNYAFFMNGQNLGPAVPRELNQFWDGVADFIQPGESRMVVKSVQLTAAGEISLQLKADPFNLIQESRETNNTRSIRIVVQPVPPAEVPPAPENNPPADNQNNVSPPANNPPINNPPANNAPPQDNSVTRAEARTALRDADDQCTDASTSIDHARTALSNNALVNFDRNEVNRQASTLTDARKALRDGNTAYDRSEYVSANNKADTAQKKCDRIVSKLAFTDVSSASLPSATNYNYVPQQRAAVGQPTEPSDDVQLIRSQQKITKEEVPVEDTTATPWLIASIIIGSFLVLGELSALAYFVFKK